MWHAQRIRQENVLETDLSEEPGEDNTEMSLMAIACVIVQQIRLAQDTGSNSGPSVSVKVGINSTSRVTETFSRLYIGNYIPSDQGLSISTWSAREQLHRTEALQGNREDKGAVTWTVLYSCTAYVTSQQGKGIRFFTTGNP